MRQSGAFLGFLKRVSTSEHGIAGHDRLALSVRSWSSCSIAAMRRLKSVRSTSMTLARRHRPRRARLGIAAEWRFWQVFGRCELRAVRQRTKSPSPRCSDQVINRKPWKQTQRPSETSPPRSQFIAPGSLRRRLRLVASPRWRTISTLYRLIIYPSLCSINGRKRS